MSNEIMRRRVSSGLTTIFRMTAGLFVAALFMLAIFATIVLYQQPSAAMVIEYIFSLCFFAFIAYVFRPFLFLKTVVVDNDNFYISQNDFFQQKEIKVPVENIKLVSQSYLHMSNPPTIVVEFENTTEFGSKVYFLSEYKTMFAPWEHPVVGDLSDLISLKRFSQPNSNRLLIK